MSQQHQTPEPENRCVFHGTSAQFDAFDLSQAGPGADANSSLGIHCADDPREAADYAETRETRHGGRAEVLVLRAATLNPTGLGYFEFFGFSQDGGPDMDAEGFLELRAGLIASGTDSIDYADGEQRIFCVLEPGLIEIVERLSPEEARALGALIEELDDPEDDEARFGLVSELVAKRSSALAR